MFDNLETDNLQKSKDTLGGFQIRESGLYNGIIKAIYAGQSDGGAKNVTLIITLEDGSEYSETIYVTNKQGQPYYLNKQDPTKKEPLPGFTRINEVCLALTGKGLKDQTWEKKTFKVWNKEAGEALPTAVDMATDLLGKDIMFTLLKETVDKTTKVGNEYVPTGEVRDQNVFTQVFDKATRKSVNEALDGKEAEFLDKWLTKNEGKTINRAKGAKQGAGGNAGRPPSSGAGTGSAGGAAGGSIFGNK